jgi:outer membrane protein OmpA-like peptidoglycan-associated protein
MATLRLTPAIALGVALLGSLYLSAICRAQGDTYTGGVAGPAERPTDVPGCKDMPMVPRLVTSVLMSCESTASVGVAMPLQPDAQGVAREKTVRGPYEYREYRITRVDQQDRAFEGLLNLLPMAGFSVKYSESPSTITARKGDAWLLVRISGESYNVSLVRMQEDAWTPVISAEEISREMQAHHRVSIYGIEFTSDDLAIKDHNAKILGELLKYLKADPVSSVVVESHKYTKTGGPQADMEITSRRALALVAWLQGNGIPAARLHAQGLGRSEPLTENDTPLEVQQNERIEVVKPGS